MRLITANLSRQGNFTVTKGMIPVESKMLGKNGIPYCFIFVGRRNPSGAFAQITLGIKLAEELKKRYESCPNDGDGTYGICKHCGTNITEKSIMGKVKEYTMENGIDVFKNVASHAKVGFPEPLLNGAFILDKSKKLLLLEERSKQFDRRIALLLNVEPGLRGSSSIEPVVKARSELLTGIDNRACGQRWLGSTVEAGVGIERLLILSPHDVVYVSQDGLFEPGDKERRIAAYKIVVHWDGTLTCTKVDAAASGTPSEAGVVAQNVITKDAKALVVASEEAEIPVQHTCDYPASPCAVCLKNQSAIQETV